MDVFAIANALRRHLALTAIIAVLTAAALAVLVLLVPREYEAQASYVLVNPVAAPTDAEIEADPSLAQVNRNNPYLRFSNQATVGQVLSGRVSGDAVRDSLVAQGADQDYTIAPSADYGGTGQVIDVVGTGTSAEKAQETLQLVQTAMTQQLQDMQTVYGASADSLITALPVAEPTGARIVLSGLVRSVVGVVGAGVVVLFAAISVAEARRSRREAARAATPPTVRPTPVEAAADDVAPESATPQSDVADAEPLSTETTALAPADDRAPGTDEQPDRAPGLSLVARGEQAASTPPRVAPSLVQAPGREAQPRPGGTAGHPRSTAPGASRRLP